MPRVQRASCKAWPLVVPLRQPQGCCFRSSHKALSENPLLPLCSPRQLFSLAALKSSGWTTVGPEAWSSNGSPWRQGRDCLCCRVWILRAAGKEFLQLMPQRLHPEGQARVGMSLWPQPGANPAHPLVVHAGLLRRAFPPLPHSGITGGQRELWPQETCLCATQKDRLGTEKPLAQD